MHHLVKVSGNEMAIYLILEGSQLLAMKECKGLG